MLGTLCALRSIRDRLVSSFGGLDYFFT